MISTSERPELAGLRDGDLLRGGTFNFQLHSAFWVSVAICDDQSNPQPGGSNVGANIPCQPDSDQNIYDNPIVLGA